MSATKIQPGFYDVEPVGEQGYTVREWVRGVRVPDFEIPHGLKGGVWAASPGCYGTKWGSTYTFYDLRIWRFHPIDIAAEAREGRGS